MLTIDDQHKLSDQIRHAYNLSEKFNKNSSSRIIEAGSDDHLDSISETREIFSELIKKLSHLNDLVEINFPSNKTDGEKFVMELHSLHSSLEIFLQKIKADKILYESFKSSIKDLEFQNGQVVEYINDINNFVLSDNEDYQL